MEAWLLTWDLIRGVGRCSVVSVHGDRCWDARDQLGVASDLEV